MSEALLVARPPGLLKRSTDAILRDIRALLALVIVSGFMCALFMSALTSADTSNNQSTLMLFGALSAAFGAVMNFYFGAAMKDAQQAAAATRLPPAPPHPEPAPSPAPAPAPAPTVPVPR